MLRMNQNPTEMVLFIPNVRLFKTVPHQHQVELTTNYGFFNIC